MINNIVEGFYRKQAIVMVGGKVSILSEMVNPATGYFDVQFSTDTHLRLLYRNQKIPYADAKGKTNQVNLFDVWLDHNNRREYKGITFDLTRIPNGYYNLYRGLAVTAKKGNCSLYLDHVLKNICSGDEDYFEWLLDWLADTIQNPTHTPGTAIVLRGAQGTGKGVFATQFRKIFGPHFVHITGQHRFKII